MPLPYVLLAHLRQSTFHQSVRHWCEDRPGLALEEIADDVIGRHDKEIDAGAPNQIRIVGKKRKGEEGSQNIWFKTQMKMWSNPVGF